MCGIHMQKYSLLYWCSLPQMTKYPLYQHGMDLFYMLGLKLNHCKSAPDL